MLAAWLIIGPVGVLGLGLGLFAYRGKNARRLLASQLLVRAMPGVLCGLPVAGAGALGLLVSMALPDPLRTIGILVSCAVGLVGVLLFGWCPRRLLPRWLREDICP